MNANDFQVGAQGALSNLLLFVPKALLFVAILGGGYLLAKFCCKLLNRLLERVGFDRLVERGGIKRAMERTRWDASDLLSKTLFYFVMLFVLQLAFGVFGPNPISDLLTRVVAYLPNIFIAGLMVVILGWTQLREASGHHCFRGGLGYWNLCRARPIEHRSRDRERLVLRHAGRRRRVGHHRHWRRGD
jgi:hypothetical protein